MKYRKKPVVIEAVKWDGINLQEIIEWIAQQFPKLEKAFQQAGAV